MWFHRPVGAIFVTRRKGKKIRKGEIMNETEYKECRISVTDDYASRKRNFRS